MSTLVAGRRPTDPVVRQGTEGAAPGTIDTLGASINVAFDELPVTQDSRLTRGYTELIETLIDNRAGGYTDYNNVIGAIFGDDRDEARIWADVAKLRAQDPVKFARLPQSQEEFEYGLLSRQGRREDDKRTVDRGGAIAGFTGGAIGYMADPLNIATLPIGGGKTILQSAIRAAGVNAAVEVLEVPATIAARDKLREETTAGYLATRIGSAAAGGFVLGGAFKGGEVLIDDVILGNWDRLPQGVRSRLGDGQWDRLSPEQREQLRGTMTIDDRDLPDIAEAIIGRDNMSIDEKRAVDAMRRDAEIAETSPFKPGAAGDAAHRARLDEAVTKLLQPVQRQPNAIALPARPSAPSRGALNSGTTLSSPMAAPRAELKARIGRAESPSDTAKNPRSSATGRYQFVSETWLSYYKRRFGSQGLTDAQILAKRTDGRIQDVLMDDLIDDNAAFLRSVGEAQTAGNLYLTHFAGQGGARKLFRADPEASARSVLGDDVVRANPFLDRMSAGDVISWAHRKMQEPAPRRAGARSELADGEGVWRERLQMEIDRIDAESDAARAARAVDDPVGAAIDGAARALPSTDHELVPVDGGVTAPADVPPVVADRSPVMAATGGERSAAIEAALRAELAKPDAPAVVPLARELGVGVDEVMRIVDVLAADADAAVAARATGLQTRGQAEPARTFDDIEPTAWERDNLPDASEADVIAFAQRWDSALPHQQAAKLEAAIKLRPEMAHAIRDANPIAAKEQLFRAVVDRAVELADIQMGRAAASRSEPVPRAAASGDAVDAPASVDDVAFDPSSKWESPTDKAAIEQADSVIHDLTATIAPDDARGFYLDEDGVARNWADIADELAADAAELEAVRACL